MHDIAMFDCFQDLDFIFNADDVSETHVLLIDQLHSHFLTCGQMHG